MHLQIINCRRPNCAHKKGKEAQAETPAPLKRLMFPRLAVGPFEHPKGQRRRFLCTATESVQRSKVARVFAVLISSLSNRCYPTKWENKNGLQSLSFLFSLCVVENFHSPHVPLLYLYGICQNKYCSPFIFSWYCTGPSQIKQSEVRKVEMNHRFKTIVLCGVIYVEVFV